MLDITTLLQNMEAFFKDQKKEQFMEELKKVPKYENAIQKILSQNENWVQMVQEKGTCYFYIERAKVPHSFKDIPENLVYSKIFFKNSKEVPVLVVASYNRFLY